MREWNWELLAHVSADEAPLENVVACPPGSCPCSCLRNMVGALDVASIEQGLLQAQAALGAVTGTVMLSVYTTAGDGSIDLVATGYAAENTFGRIKLKPEHGSIIDSVVQDSAVRWLTVDEGSVFAVGIAPLRDLGRVVGVVVAEFIRGEPGVGKPSAVCLQCVASVMSVVLLRSRIAEAEDSLLTLARCRSVSELTVQATHDFNNMMQGVLGNTALARMDIDSKNPATKSLAGIEESATRAAGLARRLLDFARDSARGETACDAGKVAGDALELAEILYLKGIPVTRNVPRRPVIVRMTDNDLENVLVLGIKSGVLRLKPVSSACLTVRQDPGSMNVCIDLDLEGTTQDIRADDEREAGRLVAAAQEQAARAGARVTVACSPGTVHILLTATCTLNKAALKTGDPRVLVFKDANVLVVGLPSPLPMLLEAAGCVARQTSTWSEAMVQIASFNPQVIFAVVSTTEEMEAAAEGRLQAHVPVIAVCVPGVAGSKEATSIIDDVLGMPLELDDLRDVLARLIR